MAFSDTATRILARLTQRDPDDMDFETAATAMGEVLAEVGKLGYETATAEPRKAERATKRLEEIGAILREEGVEVGEDPAAVPKALRNVFRGPAVQETLRKLAEQLEAGAAGVGAAGLDMDAMMRRGADALRRMAERMQSRPKPDLRVVKPKKEEPEEGPADQDERDEEE